MAQRAGHTAAKRLLRRLRRVPRGALIAGAVAVVVLVVAGSVLAGTVFAGGETFRIERADSAEVAGRAGDGLGEDAGAADARDGADTDADGAASDADGAADVIVVDVDGAVVQPGIVELPAGSRVADAVAAAGGLAADADTQALNQAALLADGEKVYVPREGDDAPAVASGGGATGGASDAAGEAAAVNINTATLDELDGLPGVGPATAQAIIDEREENGPFTAPEDLMRVSGIGEKKFEKLANLICV